MPNSIDAPAALSTIDVEQPGFFLREDYFDLLAWLRANEPVYRSANGMVLVSRYEDIRVVSRDPTRFTSRRGALINDPLRASEPNDDAGSLLHLDPPLHADYRKLLNREFTPRAVAKMEQTVRQIVADTFDALEAHLATDRVADLVEHIALPVPVRVIAELLGMADQSMADIRRWSDAVIAISDDPSPEVLADAMEFFSYLNDHVHTRFDAAAGDEQPDDLLSLLAASQVAGARLTPAQLEMFCLTLVVAGNETTRSLISGGAHALAQHPDQRVVLADGPDLVGGAVEECLRWVTPIQAFCRTVNADDMLGSTSVAAGDYLVMLYASGNRDEAVFGADADMFDVQRPATPAHVAFGFGEHLCLGASLARLEARLVFEELLHRHPSYEIANAPVYEPSTLTRNLKRLDVAFR